MKIGILGTGFGAYHARLYKNISSVDSIIIYGRDKEKLEKISIETGIEATNDLESIISDKSIDLIDVCMPSIIHREYVIGALKNGKDVFCETPVALNLEDALAMKKASNRYGKKVYVDNFIKFEPPYRYLYNLVKYNKLGKLKVLHIKRKTPPIWGKLGLDKIVTNLMIHEFDFISWLLGNPENISSYGIEPKDGEAHVEAILTYNSNTIVNIQASSLIPKYHAFTVGYEADFEYGTIEYFENGYADRTESSLKLFTDKKEENVDLESKNCYEEAFKHVLECSKSNIYGILWLDDAIKSLRLALEVKDKMITF
ncbi:Gfo/Idh/MocA family protein [Clostridium oryzae]|uniref:Inositol 2-dehydrogenase n=1 Tax=Clostridium oryzae TaxID=1450648 RepID=A0A1V4ITR8_9CLOT|nr:Gfo/Idh/MocA family oxidoreductase [Clostridium oryzae]OPJ62857.1 inositol 2-dehydrogenase [Clostridium oryzae]